ncbi:hypothetical protein BOX15_Mlig017900g2, partial [Macrostomum lignano]
HGMSDHAAKMSVMHGIGLALPDMHSPSPFHQRIFQQMRQMHARMMEAMKNAKHAIVQRIQIRIHSMPPGPDGKPRYQVEIHERRIPVLGSKGKDQLSKPPIRPDGHRPLLGGNNQGRLPQGDPSTKNPQQAIYVRFRFLPPGPDGKPRIQLHVEIQRLPSVQKQSAMPPTGSNGYLFALLLVFALCFWVFWRAAAPQRNQHQLYLTSLGKVLANARKKTSEA